MICCCTLQIFGSCRCDKPTKHVFHRSSQRTWGLISLSLSLVDESISIKQPTVAGMEKVGRDLKLSTLKRYIEAVGGKLRIEVELPDGTLYGFSI